MTDPERDANRHAALQGFLQHQAQVLLQLVKDAERYRWLKEKHNDWESSWRVYQPHPTLGSSPIDQGLTVNLDDVIDEAMKRAAMETK